MTKITQNGYPSITKIYLYIYLYICSVCVNEVVAKRHVSLSEVSLIYVNKGNINLKILCFKSQCPEMKTIYRSTNKSDWAHKHLTLFERCITFIHYVFHLFTVRIIYTALILTLFFKHLKQNMKNDSSLLALVNQKFEIDFDYMWTFIFLAVPNRTGAKRILRFWILINQISVYHSVSVIWSVMTTILIILLFAHLILH